MNNLEGWTPRERPPKTVITGRYVNVAPWNREVHGATLWQQFGGKAANDLIFHFGWPQLNRWQDLADMLDGFNDRGDFITCIFERKTDGAALGMASYMNIVPEHGRIETGAIAHGAALKHSRAGTEGHYLMARRVFDDLGYRRYEWKLNNPNQASHDAAKRLGFAFEGVFRQHQVMPYGNRDTAWYSMLDGEWPVCRQAFETWLAPENFYENDKQIRGLAEIRAALTSKQG